MANRLLQVFTAGIELGKRYSGKDVPHDVIAKEFEKLRAEFKQDAGPDPDQQDFGSVFEKE